MRSVRSPVVALLAGLLVGGRAHAEPVRWVRACLHAHSAKTASGIGDNGDDSPATLIARLSAAGFAIAFHTPHSIFQGPGDPEAAFAASATAERALSTPALPVDLGEELEVAHGPAWRASYTIAGQKLPGNLEHLSVLGAGEWLAAGTTIAVACAAAHARGGVCLVNHPGPGPLGWEVGYWEAPATRALVDGVEVYNGQAYAGAGVHYEARYLDATAEGGSLGALRLAAIGAPDTHGDHRTPELRRKNALLIGLLGTTLPTGDPHGLELGAATLVALAPGVAVTAGAIEAAIHARRTVALFGFDTLEIDCPGLGQVIEAPSAELRLAVDRRVDITLYKEGKPLRRWRDADQATFREAVDRPTAYVWGFTKGTSRALTSAIWYRPTSPKPSP